MTNDYNDARRQGERARRWATVSGRNPYLTSMEDFVSSSDIAAELDLGIHEIPLYLYAGTRTRGRQNAFAENFMPLLGENSEFAKKWSDLYESQLEEGIREPVKAYEYMGRFYAEEGNKRVSVMKYLGAYSIPTHVIRCLPKKTDGRDVQIYYEYLPFYEVTGIFGFMFTREGCFEKLAALLGRDLVNPWPETLVKDFKNTAEKFASVFYQKGGSRTGLRAEDALLISLGIYPLETLRDAGNDSLGRHMDRLWKEFLTESGPENLKLIDNPWQVDKKAGALNDAKIMKMLNVMPVYTASRPLKAAFLYANDEESSSWTYGHELGRNELHRIYGDLIDTIKIENCNDEASTLRGINTAIDDDDDVIFTTSPLMMPAALKVAIDNPSIKFLNCSTGLTVNAVRSYEARTYEAKFLMGALAAIATSNHRIGYCAGAPIYGTLAEINAFAIGASMIDPEARITLVWTGKKNYDWESDLTSQGISVISGKEFITPRDEKRRHGLYRILPDGSAENLAAPMQNWGRYYALIIESILTGAWESKSLTDKSHSLNYWYGISSGVIDVIYSKKLSYNTLKLLELLKDGLVKGTISPFDGELRSREGVVKTAGSDRLTYEEILSINWLNENVDGEIPPAWEMNDSAKKSVSVAGVKK